MKAFYLFRLLLLFFAFHLFTSTSCKKLTSTPISVPGEEDLGMVRLWLTTSDGVQVLQKGPPLRFTQQANVHANIDINPAQTYQTVDGFGFSLTGGSAMLIHNLPAAQRSGLIAELFGKQDNSIQISYLRVSIGASDLDAEVFSYNDLPTGETDLTLDRFSIERDKAHLIPLLKEILAVNPAIKIIGSPWSPPVWMKDNSSTKGGSLKPKFYSVYAAYFVKYIQAMKAEGISIDAITPQNEPLHPGNNPSLFMTAEQQADFIKNHLGPKFWEAGIQTKIVIYDHNADRPDYPLTVLADPGARAFIDGTAFHLYAGDVSALSKVHDAYPEKSIYFTEQWTGANGTFSGDLRWHLRHVIIGSMRNWSRVALEWNLANDPGYGPHTPGGCTECKGALTIGNNLVSRNVSYYIIAHAAKFIPPGSVRIGSNITGNVYNVAFKTPANEYVLVAVNDGDTPATFNIRYAGKWATATLPAGAAASYVWQ